MSVQFIRRKTWTYICVIYSGALNVTCAFPFTQVCDIQYKYQMINTAFIPKCLRGEKKTTVVTNMNCYSPHALHFHFK
jgi:hypothetical protein